MTSKEAKETILLLRPMCKGYEYAMHLKRFLAEEQAGNLHGNRITKSLQEAETIALDCYPVEFLNYLTRERGITNDRNQPF